MLGFVGPYYKDGMGPKVMEQMGRFQLLNVILVILAEGQVGFDQLGQFVQFE